MDEEQPDIDLVAMLIHIIRTFGPFTESADDFINGVAIPDGEWTISVSQPDETNVVIDAEKIA